MRRAKQNDYWRAVERNQGWKARLIRANFSDIPGIGTGEVNFAAPLNLLCGPNGAGKTTLLKSIGAALDPSQINDSPTTKFRVGTGRMSIVASLDETIETVVTDFAQMDGTQGLADKADIIHVDTSSVASELQSYFCQFPNLQDALNGVPVLDASPENVEMLRFLTNVPYSAARVFTLEETTRDSSGEDERVAERPFFEVEVGGVQYDSRSMGLGELAAFYLWWSLERVSDRTILLIEEPESFLSPLCQSAFAAVLAKYTATKKPFVVITTHSPQIIQSAPESSILFVFREGGNVRISDSNKSEILLKTVGIEPRVRTLLLVEDNAARIFSRLWIAHFSALDVSSVELVPLGGEGNIMNALKAFPNNPKSMSFIGLLDGDAEARGYAGARVTFLPGGEPIEKIYRTMVETELDRVDPILGIGNLRQALFAQQGMEIHEWFEALKANSNLTTDQLHFLLFRAWIQREENRVVAARYYEALRGLLDRATY